MGYTASDAAHDAELADIALNEALVTAGVIADEFCRFWQSSPLHLSAVTGRAQLRDLMNPHAAYDPDAVVTA